MRVWRLSSQWNQMSRTIAILTLTLKLITRAPSPNCTRTTSIRWDRKNTFFHHYTTLTKTALLKKDTLTLVFSISKCYLKKKLNSTTEKVSKKKQLHVPRSSLDFYPSKTLKNSKNSVLSKRKNTFWKVNDIFTSFVDV